MQFLNNSVVQRVFITTVLDDVLELKAAKSALSGKGAWIRSPS